MLRAARESVRRRGFGAAYLLSSTRPGGEMFHLLPNQPEPAGDAVRVPEPCPNHRCAAAVTWADDAANLTAAKLPSILGH